MAHTEKKHRQTRVPLRFLLFDLDETLYPPQNHMFQEVGQRINQYMERMGIPQDQVVQLRQLYYQRYGTTLRGLQIHHQVDTEAYLDYVHDFEVRAYIQPNPALDKALGRLSQEKCVFTNATGEYARRVLQALGVEQHFPWIFDIHAFRYHCKPDPQAFHIAMEALSASGPECLLIEDNLRNVRVGRELGLHTVLVSPAARPANEADFVVSDVVAVEAVVRQLEDEWV
jgi:putative hydrolase of the HAD superfamily